MTTDLHSVGLDDDALDLAGQHGCRLSARTDDYTEVKLADGTHLILAEELVEKVLTDEKHQAVEYEVVRRYQGQGIGRAELRTTVR